MPVPARHPIGVGQTAPPAEEEDYKEETGVNPYEDESYFSPRSPPPGQQLYGAQVQGQAPTSPMGRSSPWNNPGDWRPPTTTFSSVTQNNVDDVTRVLNAMELSRDGQIYNNLPFQSGQPTQFPRFHPPASLSPGMRSHYIQGGNGNACKLQLNTDLEGHSKTPTQQPMIGPVSAGSLTLATEHPKGVSNSADLLLRWIVQSPPALYHGIRKRSSLANELQTPTWSMRTTKRKRTSSQAFPPSPLNILIKQATCKRLVWDPIFRHSKTNPMALKHLQASSALRWTFLP